MSGEVKLGEADYTVFWERPGKAFWCLQPFQGFLLLKNAKKKCQKSYLAIMNKSGTYID